MPPALRSMPGRTRLPLLAALGALMLAQAVPQIAAAQGVGVSFDQLKQDESQPLEVNSDSLEVDQAAGTARFMGNVIVSQGDLRLQAAEVRAYYAEGEGGENGRITKLDAIGNVVIAAGDAGIEAQAGTYDLDRAEITMTGNVVLTQSGNVISGQRLVIDVASGTGRIDGRVRTLLNTRPMR